MAPTEAIGLGYFSNIVSHTIFNQIELVSQWVPVGGQKISLFSFFVKIVFFLSFFICFLFSFKIRCVQCNTYHITHTGAERRFLWALTQLGNWIHPCDNNCVHIYGSNTYVVKNKCFRKYYVWVFVLSSHRLGSSLHGKNLHTRVEFTRNTTYGRLWCFWVTRTYWKFCSRNICVKCLDDCLVIKVQ